MREITSFVDSGGRSQSTTADCYGLEQNALTVFNEVQRPIIQSEAPRVGGPIRASNLSADQSAEFKLTFRGPP